NHIDDALMLELSKVKNIAKPTESLLVADAMTGQDAVNIAQNFDKQISITGIILTRMDGDARGGAALSMHHVTGKPIKFIGVGEKADALELFQPERIAGRILGQGDIVSLVEKAQEQSDEDENQKLAKKIAKGKFDMNDLSTQLQQMSKMGGLSKIMDMLPGAMNKMPVKKLDDTLIKRQVAIISSMTKKERRKPDLIHASRKKRIAAGSGTSVQEVNKLMKQFLTMSKMMKRVAGGKIPPDVMRMLSSTGGGMPPKF
ncbi:MAG: signal recognition particle protein, partial [Alphaproteobacteria bacterium]|nr:signal recognition particle protein [Alphaproteobacteria bacterium]